MDTLNTYRQIIQTVLTRYSNLNYAYGDINNKVMFDEKTDQYAVISVGWQGTKRIHGCLIHVEIIDEKVWIQRDGTEDGIANEFVEAGIPKDQIVLGFHELNVRQHTGFAVA